MLQAKRTWLTRSLTVGGIIALSVVLIVWRANHRRAQFDSERTGFNVLGGYANGMIEANARGVVRVNGHAYIESFDEFFEYVKQKNPSIVSSRDAANPFPGLLPGPTYTRPDLKSGNLSAVLLGSEQTYFEDVEYRFRLTCDGTILPFAKRTDGYRLGERLDSGAQ